MSFIKLCSRSVGKMYGHCQHIAYGTIIKRAFLNINYINSIKISTCPHLQFQRQNSTLMQNETSKEANKIDKLISERLYVEAANLLIENKSQSTYDIDKIAIPLYLQQNDNELDRFLNNEPKLQLAFIKYLDQNLHNNASLIQLCESIHPDKINCQYETIKDKLGKYLKKYGFKMSTCPHLLYQRQISMLHLFIKKKYWKKNITEESWTEIMEVILETNPLLPQVLVKALLKENDLQGVLQWAKKYNIPHKDWPEILQKYENGEIMHVPWKMPVVQDNYLSLTVPVEFVQTPSQLLDCLEVISTSPVIGIDLEWKPDFNIQDEVTDLALIQIAIPNQVFLIDMFVLKSQLEEAHWSKLMSLFTDPNILKLACDFGFTDIDKIKKCSPLLNNMSFTRILDIQKFWQKLPDFYPDFVNSLNGNIQNRIGLSTFAKYLLGHPINKKETLSNWEIRPLRETLITYAALDAHCLIQIFDVLKMKASDLNLDYEELVTNSTEDIEGHPKESI